MRHNEMKKYDIKTIKESVFKKDECERPKKVFFCISPNRQFFVHKKCEMSVLCKSLEI